MRYNCSRFEDQWFGRNLRQITNDLYLESAYNKLEDLNYKGDFYLVSSTKELIPPYIPTEGNNKQPFVIKAGLILFHGTIHEV